MLKLCCVLEIKVRWKISISILYYGSGSHSWLHIPQPFNPDLANLKANKCVMRSLADRLSLWSSPASQQTVKEQSTHVQCGGGVLVLHDIRMVSHLCFRFFFFAVWTKVKTISPKSLSSLLKVFSSHIFVQDWKFELLNLDPNVKISVPDP